MAETKPRVGDLKIDLSALTYLKDLPSGGLRGLQPEKDGINEALTEVFANQETYGATAKITEEELKELQDLTTKIDQLDDAHPAVEKLLEMIEETRAILVDRREKRLHSMAKMIDILASDHPELAARYERLRRYRSAKARKAAQTRARKAAEAATEKP